MVGGQVRGRRWTGRRANSKHVGPDACELWRKYLESCKYTCTGFKTLDGLGGLIKRKEEEEECNEVSRQAEESEASATETTRQCRENQAFEQAAGSVVLDRVSFNKGIQLCFSDLRGRYAN